MKAVLTVMEAAYYLGSTEKTLHDLVRNGQIPFRKRGSKIVFIQRELDAWLDQLPGLRLKDLQRQQGSRNTVMDEEPELRRSAVSFDSRRSEEAPIRLKRGPVGPKIPRPAHLRG
jgi:excisionase family DNA binding protein